MGSSPIDHSKNRIPPEFRSLTWRFSPCRCSRGQAANLFLRGAAIVLGSDRRQSGHREKRQNDEPLIVVINGDKRPLGGDRYVIPVWHRILAAIRHPERERRTALYGRLDLASRHESPLRRQACVRKRFLLANARVRHSDPSYHGSHQARPSKRVMGSPLPQPTGSPSPPPRSRPSSSLHSCDWPSRVLSEESERDLIVPALIVEALAHAVR